MLVSKKEKKEIEINLENNPVKHVDSYKYLGTIMEIKKSYEKKFKNSIIQPISKLYFITYYKGMVSNRHVCEVDLNLII